MSWKIIKAEKVNALEWAGHFSQEEGENILNAELRTLAAQLIAGMTPEDFAGVFNYTVKRCPQGVKIEMAVKVSALGEHVYNFNREKISRIIEEEREKL